MKFLAPYSLLFVKSNVHSSNFSRCLTISGLYQAQPKGCYETPSLDGFHGKLFMCLDSNIPSADTVLKVSVVCLIVR